MIGQFKRMLFILIALLPLTLVACSNEGTGEKTGKAVDEMMEDAGDAMGDATDSMKDAADDMQN